eukprot:COSAG01_NODE_1664_length_9573_cov_31.637429_10_plen_126_part_00
MLKSLGFDALRKHQKIESKRFYYHCDHLGLAVIQDFPGVCLAASASIARLLCVIVCAGGGGLLRLPFLMASLGRVRHKMWPNAGGRGGFQNATIDAQFRRELRQMVRRTAPHPSVIAYSIYNEGG